MTLPEVADYLRCHPSTVYRMLKRGDGIPAKKLGSDWRFLRTDVERWLREGGTVEGK
jgi:excisionase family DNA binding protein